MNRSARRHRSTKIPNVKLRPPPPVTERGGASGKDGDGRNGEDEARRHYKAIREEYDRRRRRQEKQRARGGTEGDPDGSTNDDHKDDDDDAEDDQDDIAPLSGLVLCMSGIGEEKGALLEIARELGAIVEANLTESATHLIAYSPGSDKYTSALRVGIPIMHPSWLHAVRKYWTDAQAFDFDAVALGHILKPLQGVVLGLAGITDSSKRHDIRERVKIASGQAPIAFKLDGSFTHVLCGDASSSETLKVVDNYRRKAQRFLRRTDKIPEGERHAMEMNAAMQVKLVRMEWLEDSLEVGGCLQERHYLISEQKPTLEQRQQQTQTIRKHQLERRLALQETRRRAYEREASEARPKRKSDGNGVDQGEDHDQPRKVKRPHIQISKLVEQLNRRTSEEPRSPTSSVTGPMREKSPHAAQAQHEMRQRVKDDSIGRTKIEKKEEERQDTLEEDSKAWRGSEANERSYRDATYRIDLGDDDKNLKASEALRERGVTQILQPGDKSVADYRVLPLCVESAFIKSLRETPVTQFFIERCWLEDRLLRLDESFALQPSTHTFPLAGAEKAVVAITGLGAEDEVDRCQAETAFKAAGIRCESTFKRGEHTHLLVGTHAEANENSKNKMAKARKWGVPIVNLDFIERMYRTGLVTPPSDSARPPVHASVARISAMSNGSLAANSSVESQDTTTTLDETQYASAPGEHRRTVSEKENVAQDHTPSADLRSLGQRPWQRSASGSQAFLDGEASRGIEKSIRPSGDHAHTTMTPADAIQYSSGKDYESLGAGTLAYNSSMADDVMALLADRSVVPNGDVLRARSSNLDSGVSSGPRKYRRLPPSMRQGSRRTSRTPTRDETDEGSRVHDANDVDVAEMLFAKGREEEVLRRLASLNATQMQQSSLTSTATMDGEESLRVIYDDPVARRERRKMADLIDMARTKREEQERLQTIAVNGRTSPSGEVDESRIATANEGAMDSHSRTTTSAVAGDDGGDLPTRATKRDGYARLDYSPTIKARKQPGTAIHP